MKVLFENDLNSEEVQVEGVEFDIREDCVFVTLGTSYVRVETKDFEKLVNIFR